MSETELGDSAILCSLLTAAVLLQVSCQARYKEGLIFNELISCMPQLAGTAPTHPYTRIWCSVWTHRGGAQDRKAIHMGAAVTLYQCVPSCACAAAP